jgi:plasmid stabilization system protein ParE
MAAVVWTETAEADIVRLHDFLVIDAPDVAARAVQVILQAGDRLEQSPQRGTIVQQATGLRKLRVRFGKVGFVLHYVILADEVVILRVYHGRERRPT